MSTKKSLIAAACMVAMGTTAAGFAMNANAEVVTIGMAVPLTGSNAAYGKDIENAVNMAIEEANAKKLVIGGQPITFELLPEDDQADPKTGVQVAQQLVDKKVAVVIGHFNSGTTLPASKLYSLAGIPMITPSATNPAITQQGSKTVFSLIATDAQNAGQAGTYAVESEKAQRIGILDDRTAFGQGEADEFTKAVSAAHGTIVDHQYTDTNAVDFSSQLTHMKGANVDLVYFAGLNPQAAQVAKRMKQLGMKAQFLGGGGVMEPTFLTLAGPAAEGALAWEYGLPIEQLPKGVAFQTAYKAKYGTDMLSYAPFSYDATWAAIKAMQAANSVDPAVYVAKLRADTTTGITGKIAFTDTGALKDFTTTLYQVKDGKWTVLTVKK